MKSVLDPDRFQRAQEVFDRVMDQPADARPAAVRQYCGDDLELRALVERFLGFEHQDLGSFLARPALPETWAFPTADGGEAERGEVPARIGRFEIIRLIAEGGMGSVYEARQEHPKRRVALKVIRQGFATPMLLHRFKYEAEVLGRLQHPGIAQIFEAGTAVTAHTPAGPVEQPFFAMEYVEGLPCTEFARAHALTVDQRLELIARICDAVQHAHQKGVIHRDLKPANILVAEGDAGTEGSRDQGTQGNKLRSPNSPLVPQSISPSFPHPKILDFGIARTTDADMRTLAFATSAGQIIGTLAYMSPEQVSGDPAELDTRSDVYSLGVILYETVAGRLPHDVTSCSLADAARKIRDDDPPRLVTIHRSFAGDLEFLVAKAMAKDKARRYQSAADLGADLRRYLAGEPIEARRDSPLSQWYLLKKTIARHRAAAIGAAAFVVLLAASTVALAVMYGGQVRERKRAAAAAARAESVNTFLENMLWAVDPQYSSDAQVTVRQVLDQAVREIENGSLREQPELEAAMRGTLGQTYLNLGAYPEAQALLESALEQQRRLFGERSAEVGDVLNHVGALRHFQGRYAEAEPLLNESLAIRRRVLGPSHPDVAFVLQNLAAVHHALGDPEQAESRLREALAIRRATGGPDHPDVAASLSSLASILRARGQTEEAEAILREILAMDRRKWSGRLIPAIDAGNSLAFLLQSRGDFAGAEPLYREALALSRQVHGEGHPHVAVSLNNLAALLRDTGDLAAAEAPAREGLEIRRKTLPPDHPHTARSALLVGLILLERNQAAEAEPFLRDCLDIRKKALPPGDKLTAEAASSLGDCLTNLQRYDEAEPLLVESYPVIQAGRGEKHERTLEALRRLVRHYEARGLEDRAAEYQRLLPTIEKP